MSTNATIDTPGGWYCQTSIGKTKERKGIEYKELIAELMFAGVSFHTLTGPTARKSIEEFAKYLNTQRRDPNWDRPPKCFADIKGWESVSAKKYLATKL